MDEFGDGGQWGDWLRQVGSQLVTTASQIEVMKAQQLGNTGYYVPGKVGAVGAQPAIPVSFLLLAGAALVAVLILKD